MSADHENQPMGHTAYLSIGANLGDKIQNCRRALEKMSRDPLIHIVQVSDYFRTEPVGYLDQPWFVNAAVEIATGYSPENLLMRLKDIERQAGRKQGGVRFGPRMIDMDILLFDNLACTGPDLVIPHPRMHERAFVLRPLCDIAPDAGSSGVEKDHLPTAVGPAGRKSDVHTHGKIGCGDIKNFYRGRS